MYSKATTSQRFIPFPTVYFQFAFAERERKRDCPSSVTSCVSDFLTCIRDDNSERRGGGRRKQNAASTWSGYQLNRGGKEGAGSKNGTMSPAFSALLRRAKLPVNPLKFIRYLPKLNAICKSISQVDALRAISILKCMCVCVCRVISFVMDGKLGWLGMIEESNNGEW